MDKKYEFTGVNKVGDGVIIKQIKALRDFDIVKKGEIGGYIQDERNLSHDGNAWVGVDAHVYGKAKVYGNAIVSDNAWVFGYAEIYGDAEVYDSANVYGNAKVYDKACVYGNSLVYGKARVYGNAWVFGNAKVYNLARVSLSTRVGGNEIRNELTAIFSTSFVHKK